MTNSNQPYWPLYAIEQADTQSPSIVMLQTAEGRTIAINSFASPHDAGEAITRYLAARASAENIRNPK